MKISARNQLRGRITKITEGAVNCIVVLDVNGTAVSGTISMEAMKELGLKTGGEAAAVIKATEVMVGIGPMAISARNKLPGKISDIAEGAVNGIVKRDIGGGNTITATISLASITELGLKAGSAAVAVIKSTSVMFAVD
jgi:molybdate transport system regulatory protein